MPKHVYTCGAPSRTFTVHTPWAFDRQAPWTAKPSSPTTLKTSQSPLSPWTLSAAAQRSSGRTCTARAPSSRPTTPSARRGSATAGTASSRRVRCASAVATAPNWAPAARCGASVCALQAATCGLPHAFARALPREHQPFACARPSPRPLLRRALAGAQLLARHQDRHLPPELLDLTAADQHDIQPNLPPFCNKLRRKPEQVWRASAQAVSSRLLAQAPGAPPAPARHLFGVPRPAIRVRPAVPLGNAASAGPNRAPRMVLFPTHHFAWLPNSGAPEPAAICLPVHLHPHARRSLAAFAAAMRCSMHARVPRQATACTWSHTPRVSHTRTVQNAQQPQAQIW